MKKLLSLAALGLLAAGCGMKTANYSDDEAIPLKEGGTDSLILSISIEYPVKGIGEEALTAITTGILNTAFDMEDVDPTSVEETAIRYKDNLKDEYFNENEGLPADRAGNLSWTDRIDGYFSGSYKGYESYTVDYFNFRGGPHGINTSTPVVFERKTGRTVPEEEFFMDGYRDGVAELIRAHLPDALDQDEDAISALFDPDSIGPNGLYRLTEDGVSWFFQPLEIAPSSLGIIIVSIPWPEIKEFVRK